LFVVATMTLNTIVAFVIPFFFNDTDSSSDYNFKMIGCLMNSELEKIWKEVVIA
jgi:hypothetical protein